MYERAIFFTTKLTGIKEASINQPCCCRYHYHHDTNGKTVPRFSKGSAGGKGVTARAYNKNNSYETCSMPIYAACRSAYFGNAASVYSFGHITFCVIVALNLYKWSICSASFIFIMVG